MTLDKMSMLQTLQ